MKKNTKIIKNMMNKYKKYINYLISGVITVIISVVTFKIFLVLNIKYVIAFTLSQILAIAFAFFATRTRVYDSKATNKKEIFSESLKFFVGRAFTYIVNLVLFMIAVDIFKFDECNCPHFLCSNCANNVVDHTNNSLLEYRCPHCRASTKH